MAPMYGNGGGGKAARAEKKEAKKELKETRQLIKTVAPKGIKKAVKEVKKEKGISLKERADKMAANKGRLSQLDIVSIPLKPSSRREMFRNQRKGK